jgi:hypothetical protein
LADVAAFAAQMSSWRYWQLMNVLYVLDSRDIDGPGLARRYEQEGIKVFEVGDPFPRARVVHQTIASDDFMLLADDTIDLKTTVLVPPGVSLPFTAPVEPSRAYVTQAYPGFLAVETETQAEGLLVLSNINYPGWQATLDGQPAEIYRANGIFQGVFIPPGKRQVVLSFEPDDFKWGVWLSLVVGGVVLGLILGASRGERKETHFKRKT